MAVSAAVQPVVLAETNCGALELANQSSVFKL